jgi:gluconolactonase
MFDVKNPKFHEFVGEDARVEKVAGGFTFTEGPVTSRLGFTLFSDIPANRIMKFERGAVSVFRENSNGANGLTFDHQGRLLVCEKDRVTRTEKDGKITVLAATFGGKPLTAPNDVVYSIDGSIYFTDLRGPGVYQITRKGEVRLAAADCQRPNGVALAPNQRKLYIADSGQRNVHVYEIEAGGELKNGKVLLELKGDKPGVPDGMKTDEAGNLWVTGPGGVWVIDATGQHLGTILTPEVAANCGWAEGFRGLYITARTSLYKIATKVSGTRTY